MVSIHLVLYASTVSIVGLGGEGVLRTFDREKEAQAVIRAAIEQGITHTLPIVGCSSPAEVRTLSSAATSTEPLFERDQATLVEKFRPYASKMAFYRGAR